MNLETDILNVYGVQESTGLELNLVQDEKQLKIAKRGKLLPCSCKTASKIFLYILALGVFATTTYFITQEALGSRNVRKLSICSLINGGSLSCFFHMALPEKYGKKIRSFISSWSYETLLTFTQVYLNLAPRKEMKLLALPFIWGFGVLEAKDVLSVLSMKKSELSLTNKIPKENELIRALGFSTRSRSTGSKIWNYSLAITAIGMTIFNFLPSNKYIKMGDFGKIGLYQDMIALFSGNIAGNSIAQIMDNKKEKMELKHSRQILSNTLPISIKMMRIAKNSLMLLTPLFIGALLTIPTSPNSLGDYAAKLAVGILYGANQFIARREFENPKSKLHPERSSITVDLLGKRSPCITKEKVKNAAKKYFPSIGFFGALVGFMAWAAATNTGRVDYAIIVLLLTSLLAFISTEATATHYTPKENGRVSNELSFRLIFAQMALSIFFEYLTTKLSIGDQHLSSDSTSLYVLALITWFFWGLNVGNNRAINIQPKRSSSSLPITPPITMQELSKTFVNSFK